MNLPDWMPMEAWNGFKAMRKAQKKPMTERAEKMMIGTLQKLRDAGQDIEVCLEKSERNCWLDVYPVRDERHSVSRQAPAMASLGKAGQATANNAQDWLEAQ